MPTRFSFKIDRAGVGMVLKSDAVAKVVEDAANEVARNVSAQKLEAASAGEASGTPITGTVSTNVTDRARANVTIEHPAGLAMQAKHGVLTKAAAQAQLEVKAKGD